MREAFIEFAYLVASVLFIVGLKGLTHPRTAVRGNIMSAVGMAIAMMATMFDREVAGYTLIIFGILIGAGIGAFLARSVRMTAMPQMVALLNGLGGGASLLVAGAYLFTLDPSERTAAVLTAMAASGLIGGLALSGSLVACAKLEELEFIEQWDVPQQQLVNAGLGALCLLLCVLLVFYPKSAVSLYWLLGLLSLALGMLLVNRIGGADMPVVIAMLNALSGLAAAATGFVIRNDALIIAGALVGATGWMLTRIMCRAMNRSLPAVLFGTLHSSGRGASADDVYANVRSTSAEEVAMMLEGASRVAIVPGYGMAVAQAQRAVRDLTNVLTSRGVNVEFGIHPVAGRMPGHMNVLLAEVDIAYDRLKEMDEINSEMDQIDVAIVLGANDVVNPVARTDPNSPIAGMPIIDVEKARSVVVIKRSLSPGMAGIPNPLFAASKTLMLFGDGKQVVLKIIKALQKA
ncbi:MAG: NAD(P)(+) transhydrogenase (Re/Si-specific) subunit beta [Planctomycetaceae bacterium]